MSDFRAFGASVIDVSAGENASRKPEPAPGQFSIDWFSENIPTFSRLLAPLAGRAVTGLEIGSFEGLSASWLLRNVMTHPKSCLICIDLYRQPVLERNLRATGARRKVKVKIGWSRDRLYWMRPGVLDFAYVDGSHWTCDVLEDALMVFQRTKVGGIIGFDDYLWDDPAYSEHGTPKPAIDAFLHGYAHKLQVLEHGYQVWVRKLSE